MIIMIMSFHALLFIFLTNDCWVTLFPAKKNIWCKRDRGCTNALYKDFSLMLTVFFFYIKFIYWFQIKSYHFKNLYGLYNISEMFHLSLSLGQL